MKQTALKLLKMVYREQKLPAKGIDETVIMPITDDREILIHKWNNGDFVWILNDSDEDHFRDVLAITENGDILTDVVGESLDFDIYDENDAIWPAIIKWCVDRLY